MTRSGFIRAKLLMTLGLGRTEKYRANAAFEAQLLRDSENIMGELVWEEMENVEEISAEYWQLRKLSKKHSQLAEKVEELTQILDESQEARTVALEEVETATKDNVVERDKCALATERLRQEREDILRDGRLIKRAHSGLKTKLEVLLEESDPDASKAVEKTREELKVKRDAFEDIRKRRDDIDKRISDLQVKLDNLNTEISSENDAIRNKAEQQFGTIGKTNKELAGLRNELGLVDTERSDLCSEIGRFVIRNSQDPEVKNATRKQRGLLTLIEKVRNSTKRNKKLLGNF